MPLGSQRINNEATWRYIRLFCQLFWRTGNKERSVQPNARESKRRVFAHSLASGARVFLYILHLSLLLCEHLAYLTCLHTPTVLHYLLVWGMMYIHCTHQVATCACSRPSKLVAGVASLSGRRATPLTRSVAFRRKLSKMDGLAMSAKAEKMNLCSKGDVQLQ